MEQLTIQNGTLPVSVRKSNGSSFVAKFDAVIKPALDAMTVSGQFAFYPTKELKKDRRDFVWLANKHGKAVGKRFLVETIDTTTAKGLNFYLAEIGLEIEVPKTEAETMPEITA